MNNFSQKHFLKNNNEANEQDKNIRLSPKKNLCMERLSKHSTTVTKNPVFFKMRYLLSLA